MQFEWNVRSSMTLGQFTLTRLVIRGDTCGQFKVTFVVRSDTCCQFRVAPVVKDDICGQFVETFVVRSDTHKMGDTSEQG